MGPFYGTSKGHQKRGEFKAIKVSLDLVISRLGCYLYCHLKNRQGVKMKEYPGTKRFGNVLFPIVLAIVGLFMVFDGSLPTLEQSSSLEVGRSWYPDL